MRKNTVKCDKECIDPKTKKAARAEFIGVKEKTFVYWCRVGCHQFNVRVIP